MLGKVVKVGILAGIVVLLGAMLFRPAALFGVDAEALANSLGGEVNLAQAACVPQGSDRWRCVLRGGTVDGVEYELTTHRFGCWSASMVARPAATGQVQQSVSGCIGLSDELGD